METVYFFSVLLLSFYFVLVETNELCPLTATKVKGCVTEINMFHCSMCYFSCVNYTEFCRHSVRMHKNDPNFIVHCSVGGCSYSSKSWNAFKLHCSRKHANINNNNVGIVTDGSNNENEVEDEAAVAPDDTNSNLQDNDMHMSHETKLAYSNAAFLLKLEAQHNLTKVAIDSVVSSTSLLIDEHQELYRSTLLSTLNENIGQPYGPMGAPPQNAFATFKTDFLRRKFYSSHCNLIEPVGIVLGKSPVIKKTGKIEFVKRTGYYIPIFDSLQALLRLPDVAEYVHHPHLSTNEYMYDICDGQYFQENKCFQENINTLQFILNTDEIEVVNPLGSHVKKHKLAMFYYTLGNIPPEFRSRLSCIQLLAVALTKDLKKFGLDKLLKDFVTGLDCLSKEGRIFTVGNVEINVQATLVIAPCDTPAAGWLGGLKEGVSFAYKSCRNCDVPSQKLKTLYHEDASLLRNTESHKKRCEALQNLSADSKSYWSKQWGINGHSVLSNINGVDIPGCLVQDPMHLLMEGVVRREIQLLLNYCVTMKYFSLKWFNNQILSFRYSKTDANNRPQTIDTKALKPGGKIKQTAMETFTLFCLLPFIIGSKIPTQNESWINALHLLQIMLLSTSPFANKSTAASLEYIVFIYLSNFSKCYPKASFVPKMHYLTHLPRQLLKFGPLRLHWCMRFEGKHGFFKKVKWTNFKNLPLSVAHKHQLFMCYKQLGHNGRVAQNFLYDGDQVAEGKEVSFLESFPEIVSPFQQQNVYLTPSVQIHGHMFSENTVLLIDVEHLATTPQLAIIKQIVVVEGQKYFIVTKLEIEEFNIHLNSYVVNEKSEDLNLVKYADLKFKWPETLYAVNKKKFVMLRCSPFVEPLF